jgi:2-oxoisovalerate dehydrogenase E1 component
VLALHHRHDPGDVYDRLFANINEPTLVIENKVLYSHHLSEEVPHGFTIEHGDEPFPTTRMRPHGAADLTIVCYGEMFREVEAAVLAAFDEHEIICEVICPLQLYPLNLEPVLASVSASRRLLVVEEGVGFAAFGAEVIAQLVEQSGCALRKVRRLSAPEEAIPACAPLEKEMLPGAASILRAMQEVVADE